ncbi:hypothetical protein Tco_1160545 [Tanacetum coccineum]
METSKPLLKDADVEDVDVHLYRSMIGSLMYLTTWIPTGKMFTDNTTKVDSEPPNGSNGDITNPYECDQTLNVSAGTTNSSAAVVQEPVVSTGIPSSTRIDQDTPFIKPSFEESSSRIIIPTNVHSVNQSQEHIDKWTKDHPLDKIIGDPSRPVSTRLQLQTEALFCYYDAIPSSIEHKSYKDALTEISWIYAMKSSMSSNIWRVGS